MSWVCHSTDIYQIIIFRSTDYSIVFRTGATAHCLISDSSALTRRSPGRTSSDDIKAFLSPAIVFAEYRERGNVVDTSDYSTKPFNDSRQAHVSDQQRRFPAGDYLFGSVLHPAHARARLVGSFTGNPPGGISRYHHVGPNTFPDLHPPCTDRD